VSDRIKQAISKAQTIGPAPKRPWSPLDVILPTPDEVREMTPVERFMGLAEFLPDMLTAGASGMSKAAILFAPQTLAKLAAQAKHALPEAYLRSARTSGPVTKDHEHLAQLLEHVAEKQPDRWGALGKIKAANFLDESDTAWARYDPINPRTYKFLEDLSQTRPQEFSEDMLETAKHGLPDTGSTMVFGDPQTMNPAFFAKGTTGYDPSFARQTVMHEGQHLFDDINDKFGVRDYGNWFDWPYNQRPFELSAHAMQDYSKVNADTIAAIMGRAGFKQGSLLSGLLRQPANRARSMSDLWKVVRESLNLSPDETHQLIKQLPK